MAQDRSAKRVVLQAMDLQAVELAQVAGICRDSGVEEHPAASVGKESAVIVKIGIRIARDNFSGGVLHGFDLAGLVVANFIDDDEAFGDGGKPGDSVLWQSDMVQHRDSEGDVEGGVGDTGQTCFVGNSKIEVESAEACLNGGAVQIHANQSRFRKALAEKVEVAASAATEFEDGGWLQGGNQFGKNGGVGGRTTFVEERLNRGFAIELLDALHVLQKQIGRDFDKRNHGGPHSRNTTLGLGPVRLGTYGDVPR